MRRPLVLVMLLVGCGSAAPRAETAPTESEERVATAYDGRDLPEEHATHPPEETPPPTPDDGLADAIAHAAPGGRRVLETTQTMLQGETVVRGSCWDWVEAVYERAGGAQHTIFHGRQTGPYADDTSIQPGDWIYFVNHEWGDDTHSAIFVRWLDPASRSALMVSYAGGHRDEPGRIGEYVLTSVFHIVRLDDAQSE